MFRMTSEYALHDRLSSLKTKLIKYVQKMTKVVQKISAINFKYSNRTQLLKFEAYVYLKPSSPPSSVFVNIFTSRHFINIFQPSDKSLVITRLPTICFRYAVDMASLGTDRASNLRRECSVADQLSAHRVRARSPTRDLDNIPLLRARGRSSGSGLSSMRTI